MEWMNQFLDWNKLRLFPMATFPFEKGEISFIEQGLINHLHQSKGSQAVRIDLSTSIIPILLGLKAGIDVDYVRYFEERQEIFENNLKESDLPEPMIICTADLGLGDILYRELVKKEVPVLRWQSPKFSLNFPEEELKKKKLVKVYEESFKRIHLIRENLEVIDEKRQRIQDIELNIETLVEDNKQKSQELKRVDAEIEALNVAVSEATRAIENLEKELKVRGFWSRLIPNNERLDKERKAREDMAKERLKEKEASQSLVTFQERSGELSKELADMEALEKELRADLSKLKKEYKEMGTKQIKFVRRLEVERPYKKDLPFISEELLLERENLYKISQKMLAFLYKGVDLEEEMKDLIFAPFIILHQDELEDFVKQCPKNKFNRIYLYGGNQIALESHWEALGHFGEWISFGFDENDDIAKNVHRFIEKENDFIPFYKGEGSKHYSRLNFNEELLYIDKKKRGEKFWSDTFIDLGEGILVQEVATKRLREGVCLQSSHSKATGDFLKAKMDEVGDKFFKKDFPLCILVPNEEVKEALIRDIRRNLFSHSAIREVRQMMITKEGLSGESLDILKQWCLEHIFTAKEARDIAVGDVHILWVMGGSLESKIEESVYREIFLRTLLYGASMGIVCEKELCQEEDMVSRLVRGKE